MLLNGRHEAIPPLLMESIIPPPLYCSGCVCVCVLGGHVCVLFSDKCTLYRCCRGWRALRLNGTFGCLLVHVCKCSLTADHCSCVCVCVDLSVHSGVLYALAGIFRGQSFGTLCSFQKHFPHKSQKVSSDTGQMEAAAVAAWRHVEPLTSRQRG